MCNFWGDTAQPITLDLSPPFSVHRLLPAVGHAPASGPVPGGRARGAAVAGGTAYRHMQPEHGSHPGAGVGPGCPAQAAAAAGPRPL